MALGLFCPRVLGEAAQEFHVLAVGFLSSYPPDSPYVLSLLSPFGFMSPGFGVEAWFGLILASDILCICQVSQMAPRSHRSSRVFSVTRRPALRSPKAAFFNKNPIYPAGHVFSVAYRRTRPSNLGLSSNQGARRSTLSPFTVRCWVLLLPLFHAVVSGEALQARWDAGPGSRSFLHGFELDD